MPENGKIWHAQFVTTLESRFIFLVDFTDVRRSVQDMKTISGQHCQFRLLLQW